MGQGILFRITVAALMAAFPLRVAANLNQADAQKTAAIINNQGSNDSLQEATTSAMVAIMNLAALNIPGAFSNGYKAYGQYINSEKLDDLEARTLQRKNKLTSVGSPGASSAGNNPSAISKTTSFSQLNPSFLYEGNAAEIAAEFERQSGMKREDFLKHLGNALDSDLSFSDPDLLKKLEGHFNSFASAIPNKDFRQGLDKATGLVPGIARNEALTKLANFYADAWGAWDSAPAILTAENSVAAPIISEISPAAARAPAAQGTPNPVATTKSPLSSSFLGVGENSQETLQELLNNSEETLFQKVSRRYRTLAPLLGKP